MKNMYTYPTKRSGPSLTRTWAECPKNNNLRIPNREVYEKQNLETTYLSY